MTPQMRQCSCVLNRSVAAREPAELVICCTTGTEPRRCRASCLRAVSKRRGRTGAYYASHACCSMAFLALQQEFLNSCGAADSCCRARDKRRVRLQPVELVLHGVPQMCYRQQSWFRRDASRHAISTGSSMRMRPCSACHSEPGCWSRWALQSCVMASARLQVDADVADDGVEVDVVVVGAERRLDLHADLLEPQQLVPARSQWLGW